MPEVRSVRHSDSTHGTVARLPGSSQLTVNDAARCDSTCKPFESWPTYRCELPPGHEGDHTFGKNIQWNAINFKMMLGDPDQVFKDNEYLYVEPGP